MFFLHTQSGPCLTEVCKVMGLIYPNGPLIMDLEIMSKGCFPGIRFLHVRART